MAEDRAVTPVAGKALEVALVVLYVGLVSTALYGQVVPSYRAGAADAVGDRALATAGAEVEDAVPAAGRAVDVRTRVGLPERLRGERYAIRTDGRALVLDHPDPRVGGRRPLALPPSVATVEGSWESGTPLRVDVRGRDGALAVRIGEGEP